MVALETDLKTGIMDFVTAIEDLAAESETALPHEAEAMLERRFQLIDGFTQLIIRTTR